MARRLSDPVVAWKRAQVLLHPQSDDVRFAGPVHSGVAYRHDDVFRCDRGHRRVEPDCSCGFYAVADPGALPPSVVVTALVRVELDGRVVRHRECLRGERQRVRQVTFDGWCSFCIEPAVAVAGVRSLWNDLPAPWLRGVPVCRAHRRLFAVAATPHALAVATSAQVGWDRTAESRAARSLRRQHGARSGARR